MRDLPCITVEDGRYPEAVKKFLKCWKLSGIKDELKFRRENPSRAQRRRAKARRASKRFLRQAMT